MTDIATLESARVDLPAWRTGRPSRRSTRRGARARGPRPAGGARRLQRDASEQPGADRALLGHRGRDRGGELRTRARADPRGARRRALDRRPVRGAGRHAARPCRHARRPRRHASGGWPSSRAARSGPTSIARRRPTASSRRAAWCPTRASPASRWAAATAGCGASTACPSTRSSRPQVVCADGQVRTASASRTRTCSGRCAAAAGTSAWSPRSPSRCSRWARSSASRRPSIPSRRSPRSCAAGASSSRTRRTRSPRSW